MTIKKPIASYGTAHDELKDGDLISGKEIQLSTDVNNALNTDNEGGLLVKPQAVILGMGCVIEKPFVRRSGDMNPGHNVHIPTHKHFTLDELNYYLKNYDICIKGTSYIACKTDQNLLGLEDLSHRFYFASGSSYDNRYLNMEDKDYLNVRLIKHDEKSQYLVTNDDNWGGVSFYTSSSEDSRTVLRFISKQNFNLRYCFDQGAYIFNHLNLSFVADVRVWGGRKGSDWDAYHVFDYEILAVKKQK